MVTATLARPTERKVAVREAGGDNEVPRDSKGRPKIVQPCANCAASGRVPSQKTGNPIQCPRCKGAGAKEKAYTRTTTFIDCIEDKSNLMAWGKRMVLIGVAEDPSFINGVLEKAEVFAVGDEDEAKDAKNWLNRRAESAAEKAGSAIKAEKGTFLHGLSELVDVGEELPDDIDFGDVIDMDSYKRVTTPLLSIVHMERLVVLDEFEVAGTPDRISTVKPGVTLVAPDGHVFEEDELIITDLKTGTVDYGALKMAMQLAIYAHSKLYDWRTGEREDLGKINRQWGIIMNTPAGTGETTLYWADLTMGWSAVRIAREIRQLRSKGKAALIEMVAGSHCQSV